MFFLVAAIFQPLCNWSSKQIFTKDNNITPALPVVALGSAIFAGAVLVNRKIRKLSKDRKRLEREVIVLETAKEHTVTDLARLKKLEKDLRTNELQMDMLQRELLDTKDKNTKLQASERDARNKMITLTSAFANEYNNNAEFQRKKLFDDIAKQRINRFSV